MQQECKCPKCGTTVNAVPQEPQYITAAFKGGVLGGIVAGLIALAMTLIARSMMG
jgi:hypothetical protein